MRNKEGFCMKKITALLLVFMLAFVSGCSSDKGAGNAEIDLYFSNMSKDSLAVQKAVISKDDMKDTVTLAKKVMSLLLAGPTAEGYKALIPKDTLLRGASMSYEEIGTLNIDLSKEYYSSRDKKAPPSEELMARYSIISTLCQFEDIKKVKIYVDGKDMYASSGKNVVLSSMGASSVMINSPSSMETKTEKFVTLYFTDKNGINLYSETRKATMTDNSLEKTIVNELIRGPVSNDYVRTFSDSTQLISAETTEGVCFVNFSGGFLSDMGEGAYNEKSAVYSVVNSLTRLPDIEKVQILIDGKKPEKDELQLYSTPLGRDDSMIIDY